MLIHAVTVFCVVLGLFEGIKDGHRIFRMLVLPHPPECFAESLFEKLLGFGRIAIKTVRSGD